MFRTEIFPEPSEVKISLNDPVYLIGSCFSEHIGKALEKYKFKVMTNPFGIIYNPHSIFKLLELSLKNKPVDQQGVICHQGVYRHFDFHSDISGLKKTDLEEKITHSIESSHELLQEASWLIITFGTAIVFRLKSSGNIVGNCHKVPSNEFDQLMMDPDEILTEFKKFYNQLQSINSGINIILTVSPVRHIKSSLEKNSVSKSILRYACYRICKEFSNVRYFPSYEIVLDDLRDYRFFKPDMVHVNAVTIEYVWDKLVDAYFDDNTRKFIKEWKKLKKAMDHKPFYPESEEHQAFIKKTIRKVLAFKGKVNITEELKRLENQIHESGKEEAQ